MNFIKGIVDGILATDVDGNTGKYKYSHDPNSPENDSDSCYFDEVLQNQYNSGENSFINTSISQLNELYKAERDNCLNGLITRYGEGCVQQLSQILKSNHETVQTLTNQLKTYLSALNDVNNRMESAAVDHLKLKNENNSLLHTLQTLTSENVTLKSQLVQANNTIKSNNNHISLLNDLLRDNKRTFENMKNRCEEFYALKSEICDLKKKLTMSEGHISMLNKERDEYWLNPDRVLNDNEYKKRLSDALQRQDRAISVAKVISSQHSTLPRPEKLPSDPFSSVEESQVASELKLRVDQLEDENAHLKEINDSLHTMYADLTKSLNEVRTNYLKESVKSLTLLSPTKTTPIQLVFVQPTGVLDLTLDSESLHHYSTHTDAPLHTNPMQSVVFKNFKQFKDVEKPAKKSPKMNFRSRVIQYVTNLDSSPAPQSNSPENLLDLDSPKLQPSPSDVFDTVQQRDSVHSAQQTDDFYSLEKNDKVDLVEQDNRVEGTVADKSGKWSSDWDFFQDSQEFTFKENEPLQTTNEQDNSSHNIQNPDMLELEDTVHDMEEKTSAKEQFEDDVFDLIINEELQQSNK